MNQSNRIESGNPEFRTAVTQRVKDLGYYDELIDDPKWFLWFFSYVDHGSANPGFQWKNEDYMKVKKYYNDKVVPPKESFKNIYKRIKAELKKKEKKDKVSPKLSELNLLLQHEKDETPWWKCFSENIDIFLKVDGNYIKHKTADYLDAYFGLKHTWQAHLQDIARYGNFSKDDKPNFLSEEQMNNLIKDFKDNLLSPNAKAELTDFPNWNKEFEAEIKKKYGQQEFSSLKQFTLTKGMFEEMQEKFIKKLTRKFMPFIKEHLDAELTKELMLDKIWRAYFVQNLATFYEGVDKETHQLIPKDGAVRWRGKDEYDDIKKLFQEQILKKNTPTVESMSAVVNIDEFAFLSEDERELIKYNPKLTNKVSEFLILLNRNPGIYGERHIEQKMKRIVNKWKEEEMKRLDWLTAEQKSPI